MLRPALASLCLTACLAGCNQEPAPPTQEEVVDALKDALEMTQDETGTEKTPVMDELELVDSFYDDGWYVDYFWPGEYPVGFTILSAGIVLQGRPLPDPSTPMTLTCPLEEGATIHQWNHTRVASDDLVIVVASEIAHETVNTEGVLEVIPPGEQPGYIDIPVSPGDVIEHLRYYGEGFGLIRLNGQEYQLDVQQIVDLVDPAIEPAEEHQWVLVTCDNAEASRIWLRYDEVMAASGVAETELTEYGNATDAISE